MQEATIIITNETGLHARPAALVVSLAVKFKSNLTVEKGAQSADLKSLLGLLSLGICHSDVITIRAEGRDEREAILQITRLISGFENQ